MYFDLEGFKEYIVKHNVGGAYAVIGNPVSHSMSPFLHGLLEEGGFYAAVKVEENQLGEFCEIARERLLGFNVTVPYKIDIMKHLDGVDALAQKLGSVNTVKSEGGRLLGFNTDAYGISMAFKSGGVGLQNKRALVLGGGGAARAAVSALKEGGADVSIAVRNLNKGKRDFPGEQVFDLSAVAPGWDIIVNCTPCGMKGQEEISPIAEEKLSGCGFVYDAVYNPLKTRLLKAARRLGIRHSNGLDMLIFQAAEARRIWGKAAGFDLGSVKDKLAGQVMAQRLAGKGKKGIALCGFMGSGKSHVARAFSQRFGFELIETDAVIEREEGIPIPQIFKRFGEGYFRDKESSVIKSLQLDRPSVVSLGGGAVTRQENAAAIKESCILIYLDVPLEVCLKRAKGGGRPLLKQDAAAVAKLYEARKGIYLEACDFKLDGSRSAGEIIEDLTEII